MNKRLVATVLWFVSVWLAVGLVGNIVGRPTDVGAILGAVIAAFVWTDPTGALWHAKTTARSTDGQSDGRGATAPTR
jgi:hypothetical protein